MRTYGYKDKKLVQESKVKGLLKLLGFAFAIVIISAVWLALDQKLLFGEAWLSETYDHENWRTNEGDLRTNGAWDLETHVWKTEYVLENFPNFHWNPYWYLGMPLFKYYPLGFYPVHGILILSTDLSPAQAALLLIIGGHLLATLLTFYLCYKVSNRIFLSCLCSLFLLIANFLSLRSYGWEPITVVFLFLYPLGLLLYLKHPLRPLRFGLILVLAIAYLSHPLIWYSLLMFMGLYMFSIAVRSYRQKNQNEHEEAAHTRYIWQYALLILLSILLGAVQFLPQITYEQATSGSHMGVKYLPFYQVPYNIISLPDFFFDAGNLKGPGPIVMIAAVLILFFGYKHYKIHRNSSVIRAKNNTLFNNELISGITLVLLMMVVFYYLELYNIFPMNLLRSIQYHRIIPEFIITAAVLVAACSNLLQNDRQKIFYYALLISFVISSSIVIYNVQTQWRTIDDITSKPEFITDDIPGRITFPYTDQSLAVRNSFTKKYQVYGYYEQGITNHYADELFSVSSGFHDFPRTLLYLKAANVQRLYVNLEEGRRAEMVRTMMDNYFDLQKTGNDRYAYYEIPLEDPALVEAALLKSVESVQALQPECPREMFKEQYCGSKGEEFVTKDPDENRYLAAYVKMLEEPYSANASIEIINPDHYRITITNASEETAVIVKMTYDSDFKARLLDARGHKKELPIATIGPHFMLLIPNTSGDYSIDLEYSLNRPAKIGSIISGATFLALLIYFPLKPLWKKRRRKERTAFPLGDL